MRQRHEVHNFGDIHGYRKCFDGLIAEGYIRCRDPAKFTHPDNPRDTATLVVVDGKWKVRKSSLLTKWFGL